MDTDQTDYLLALEKKIEIDGAMKDGIVINQQYPFDFRCTLVSPSDSEVSFLLSAHQSAKDKLRITLHAQESGSSTGIIRVDYNAGHINPNAKNEHLPENFYPHLGEHLNQSHVHYNVKGYKTLAWALPIYETDFSVKEIRTENINKDMILAIQEFARQINITTKITINPLLL